jgi:hypothetical protein
MNRRLRRRDAAQRGVAQAAIHLRNRASQSGGRFVGIDGFH